MTMLPQHGFTGIPTARLVPTDDTKVFALQSTLDETRYYLSSMLHQSPKVKSVVLNTFTDGVAHLTDPAKKIVFRKSTDFGLTYGAKTTLYDPIDSTFQVQDPAIGYANNGRLHILADVHTTISAVGGTHELRYMYSDDDGTTVSSPVVITLPVTTLATFRMYGKIIQAGSVLIAPAYFVKEEGDTSESSRYIIKSTDGGANWSWVLVDGITTDYINEGELLAVTNNVLYYMCRHEPSLSFYCYKSTDAGETWIILGRFSGGVTKTTGDPCRLHKFRADNGKWYCVMYFSHRGADRLYAIYGRLDNGVDAGLGLFNSATLTILRTDPTDYLHYGDFVHYNNNMNARGAWPREASTTPLVDNEMQYFENLTTQYDTVFALINPVTIYDKLALSMYIGSPRGLVTNTDNAYGIVNVSNQVTSLKSIAPGPLAQNFTTTPGGILLNAGAIDFDGTKALGHGTPAYFKFLHYSTAGAADVNTTLYAVVKFGTGANPDTVYGLFGNNQGSSANIGYSVFYDDRSSLSRNNALGVLISKGSVGFIIEFVNQNIITPNVLFVLCIEVDLSQAANNDKVKVYINNVLQVTTVTAYSGSISSLDPTYNAQIGAIGNSGLIAVMSLKDIIVQNAIDLPGVRTTMNQALMDVNGI